MRTHQLIAEPKIHRHHPQFLTAIANIMNSKQFHPPQTTFTKTENGQSLVEYGLILVMIALSAVIILTLFGSEIGNAYSQIVGNMEEAPNPGYVVVDVVNERGKGIPNVRIYAFYSSGRYAGKTGITNKNGQLIFEDLPEETYKFRAHYRRNIYWSNEISWSNEWHAIVETNERPFTVNVVDNAGTGINNVRVYAFNSDNRYISLYGNTNEAGELVFNLPDGSYKFRADFRRNQYWSPVAISPGSNSAVLNTGQRPFSVNVVDKAGVGIENVRVYAFNGSDQYVGLYANTDSNGAISFNLPDGTFKFRADYRAHRYWSDAATTPATSNAIVQTNQQAFTANVIDYSGQGIAEVRVYAFSDSDRYTGIYANTDSSGTAIMELPGGNFKFRADYRSSRYWSNVVTHPDVTSTSVQTGQRPFTLNVVDANGQGIAGIRVYAFTDTDRYTGVYTNSDSNGQGIFDLPNGSYKFRADYRSHRFWSNVISTPGTSSTSIQTGQKPVSVRVVDNQGSAMVNVPVYVFTEVDRYIGIQARTDGAGNASLDIPNGTFKIRADYRGTRYWSTPFTTTSTTNVTVTIQL